MPKPAALRDCLMPEPAFSIFRLGRAAGAIAAAWLAAGLAGTALAADPGKSAGGIYTCVDAYGRRITSDRPIPECMDREQRQLSSSGVTRRVLRPEPTVSQLKETFGKMKTLSFELVPGQSHLVSHYAGLPDMIIDRQGNSFNIQYDSSRYQTADIIKQTLSDFEIRDLKMVDTDIEDIIRRFYRKEL